MTIKQCQELLGHALNWGERRLVERVKEGLENPPCGHCGRGVKISTEDASEFARVARGYGVL